MNKFLNKALVFFFIFFCTSCAYEPIFSEKNYNFEISEISLSGEKKINKNIKNKLKLIKSVGQQDKVKYNISIFTETERKIISKDTKGDPLKFELIVYTTYQIKKNQQMVLNKRVKKNNIYNNISDKFKLEQTENNILDNLSEIISETIISSIINLDDS